MPKIGLGSEKSTQRAIPDMQKTKAANLRALNLSFNIITAKMVVKTLLQQKIIAAVAGGIYSIAI